MYGPIYTYVAAHGGGNTNTGIPPNANLVYLAIKYSYCSV